MAIRVLAVILHRRYNCPRILFFPLLMLLLIPVTHAHPADDQGLAPSMAKALAKAKVKTVVVFDFMGPENILTQLGQDLADGFSRNLANSGGTFTVIDRAQVRAIIEKNRVASDVIRDPETSWWLARQLSADALVVGKLSPVDADRLEVIVEAAKTKDGKNIATLSVTAPISEEMRTRISKSLINNRQRNPLPSGTPMDLYPKCIYCPRAGYSSAAMANKQEGVVVLIVLVGEDGIGREMDLVKGQPYGLTQKAIEAVQKWKFQPSHDQDGKPRAVWQTIEVTFHLYK
jgi:TonB family protein